MHSNEKKLVIEAKEGETLRNIDVTSYYPSMIFANDFAPHNIKTSDYINILIDIFEERVGAKRTEKTLSKQDNLSDDNKKILDNAKLINATNKIILNGGGFGKLGDEYSVTYDPKTMVNITLTGQLSLLMLIEDLYSISGVTILSANTDGIEILDSKNKFKEIQKKVLSWEIMTGLNMEYGKYKALYARDVNNYIALYDCYLKAKGVYDGTKPKLGKTLIHTIVYKAIQAYILNQTPLEDTIRACTNIEEFLLVRKVTGGAITFKADIEYELDRNGNQKYAIIPKKDRILKDGMDIKDYCKGNKDLQAQYYFDIYDKSKPKFNFINIQDLDNVGSTVRYYFTTQNKVNLKYKKSGNKVPNSEGISLLQNMKDLDTNKYPIDYDKYISIAIIELENLGLSYTL